ncbi:hypothetical protein EJB05_22395, partial [Eragrostis curvula]
MGNCQTADAVAVVIQHPPSTGAGSGGRVERAYVATSAAAVMAANPGHYVAAVIQTGAAAAPQPPAAKAKRRLKLLRPDDTLALGGVYRLVSFEGALLPYTHTLHQFLHCRSCFVPSKRLINHALINGDRVRACRGAAGVRVQAARRAKPRGPRRRQRCSPAGGRTAHLKRYVCRVSLRYLQLATVMDGLHLPNIDIMAQVPSSDPSDPSKNHLPSDPEPDIVEAAMMLSGRFGLARPHGQWRPALPSIAEGSVVC